MIPNAEIHVVLLRGLAREARHWGSFTSEIEAELKSKGFDPRIDALDLPGTGRFSEMKSPLTIQEIASFVREKFLEARQRLKESGFEPKKTILIAISLGGMIASDWMERWPDDFQGLVLINTSFKKFSPAYRRLTVEALTHLYSIVKTQDPIERERAVLKMVSNRPEIHDRVAKEWGQIHLTRPVTLENFVRQLTAATRYSPRVRQPKIPVLVLSSSQDRMVHPSCSQVIGRRWKTQVICHPSAGHDLPLDDGPWTAQKIAEWVSGPRS